MVAEHIKPSGEKFSDGSDMLQVDIHPLMIYSGAAIQELHRELNAKEQRIETLEKELVELKKAVKALRRH